jgi:diguanylate cyclase (GGDEF)-like protein
MVEGEQVRFSFGLVEFILETVRHLLQIIKQQPAESIFVYSCSCRRGFLQELTQLETMPLQEIAPVAGFFTHGEFFHADKENLLLNATMTTLVLSELGGNEDVSMPESEVSGYNPRLTNDGVINKNNIDDRNLDVLKALTHLVNTVTGELQDANEKLQFTSFHDSLTGLYNRWFFEQEMSRLETCHTSVGMIMCDVDGLKLVNDALGHGSGDATLKSVAIILKSLFTAGEMVARIGGDEFAVILPGSSPSILENFCAMIRDAVVRYNTTNHTIPLSISTGWSFSEKASCDTTTLFKEADDAMYREKLHCSQSARGTLVQTLMNTLEARDLITEEHANRLQAMIVILAKDMGLPQSKILDLSLFARFHDIGKVGIPDHILFKSGLLTKDEKKEMQQHCEIGWRIARSTTDLLPIADWILSHHEWWNGEGYPVGLAGKNIPIECRILAILDAYDAMTNDRPYRKAMSHEAAVEELERNAGIQFDPKIIKKFVSLVFK